MDLVSSVLLPERRRTILQDYEDPFLGPGMEKDFDHPLFLLSNKEENVDYQYSQCIIS